MRTNIRVLGLCSLSLFACDTGGVTGSELRLAVDESVWTGQVEAVQQDIIEISTSFRLGDAVAAARAGVQAFIASQSACATVTATGEGGLTIDFGDLDDACTYRGRHYAGVITIALAIEGDQAVVGHEFAGFSDGVVTVDGSAEVTWTAESRRVVTDLSFDRAGHVTELNGDRVQRLIDEQAGLAGGVVVDGERAWHNERGEFSLAIDGVELRPADPVPQAGAYHLVLPGDRQVDLAFERVDADTIEVRVAGPRRDRVFWVSSTGDVEEAGA
jgi:hypothetical protein